MDALSRALREVIRLDDTLRFKALLYGKDGDFMLDGRYLTQICALCDSPGCMALSIAMGAPVNLKGDLMAPLNCASYSGSVETACLLIEAGAEINHAYKGETPLMLAVRGSTPAHIKLLLDANADLVRIEFAARHCHSAEALLPFMENGNKDDALVEAVGAGRFANVRLLLEYGAKPTLMSLLTACSYNFATIVQLLLDYGVIADDVAMQTCIYWTSIRAMEVLFKWGLAPIDYDVHFAILHNKPKSLERLLNEGAKVECELNGTYPIHVAARHGRTECLSLLITHGAHVNSTDYLGCSPVHWAAIRKNDDALVLLLQHQGIVNFDDNTPVNPCIRRPDPEWAPIHASVEGRGTRTVQDLLKEGAIQNKMWDGRTPLHIAVQNSRNDLFGLLIKYGADLKVVNAHYQTPIEVALSMGREDLSNELWKLAPNDVKAAAEAKSKFYNADGSPPS